MSKEVQVTKRFYQKHGKRWTDSKTNSFVHEKLFTDFSSRLKKGSSVLDIGCAAGIHAPLFLGIGRHLKYHGIDIADSFLNIARTRYPQLTFTNSNIADKSTLPKKKFDAFWAVAILMHIPLRDWDMMFSNIASVTKPGALGVVVLPTFHPNADAGAADQRHFTILTATEQRKYIKSRGWEILKSGKQKGSVTSGDWRWYLVQLPKRLTFE